MNEHVRSLLKFMNDFKLTTHRCTGELTYVNTRLRWAEARDYCRDVIGGDLVSIQNFWDEADARELGDEHGNQYWIGLNDGQWSDGSGFDYLPATDNREFGSGECVAFNADDGVWLGLPCTDRARFICTVPEGTHLETLTTPWRQQCGYSRVYEN